MNASAPYRGLESFQDTADDARRFFSRDRERDVLIGNLMAYRLTVLHGESGTGKSSLLRAGVAFHLRSAGGSDPVVIVFADWHDRPIQHLADAVDAAVMKALTHTLRGSREESSLTDRLAAASMSLDGGLFVLLDQVEDLLLYHGNDTNVLSELGDALSARATGASFLLAIRDDAFGQLDALRPYAPAILANTLRLDHLDRRQAEEAVRGPLALNNAELGPDEQIRIEDGLVDAVLNEVTVGQVEVGPGRGTADTTADGGVEAPYLQLVLARLWREEHAQGSRLLRLSTLHQLGGSEAIVRQHLQDALATLSEGERDLAARVFDHLVTPSGTKVAHTTHDLAGYAHVDEARLEATLDTLSSHRILRPVAGKSTRRYEIYHDVLAPSILAWTTAHEHDAKLRRERREGRARQRRLVVALIVLGALCAFAIFEWHRADQQSTQAQAQALAATARADLPTDPQQSLALAARAVRLDSDANTLAALRDTLIQAHERVVIRAPGGVTTAAFSPDATEVLVVPTSGPARVVRARDGQVRLTLKQRGGVRAAAWSVDGRRIVTVASDPKRSAELWDSQSGRVLKRLVGVGGRSVSFSGNGRRLMVASQEAIRVYNASNGALVRAIAQPAGIRRALFSPDGLQIVNIDRQDQVHVLRVRNGREAYPLPAEPSTTVAFSADSSRLVTGAANAAHVYDARTGAALLTVTTEKLHDVTAVALSTRGHFLLIGNTDTVTRIWDVGSHKQTGVLVGHTLGITSAAFSTDGKWMVTASADHTARVWRALDDDQWSVLAGSGDTITSAAFSADDHSILTVGDDGTARVWDAGTAAPLVAISRLPGRLVAAAPLPGGRDVLLAGPGREATLFDTAHRRVIQRLTEPSAVLAVAASERTLATAAGRHVTVWTQAGARIRRLTARAAITSVALDAHDRPAVGTADGTVLLYDSDGRPLRRLSGPRSSVLSVAYSPDGRRLVVGLASGTAWIWDVRGHVLKILRGHRDKVLAARFSPNGKLVATASRDHDARLWDANTGALMHVLRVHFGLVSDVEFSADGRWVATAGPISAGLFPSDTGVDLLVLTGPTARATGVWFGADDRDIFAVGLDGYVRRYECQVCGTSQELLAVAADHLQHIK